MILGSFISSHDFFIFAGIFTTELTIETWRLLHYAQHTLPHTGTMRQRPLTHPRKAQKPYTR